MPHEAKPPNAHASPWLYPLRGSTRCPWGRDCPWDWPPHVPMRTRWRWAWQAMWYAVTGAHPKEPLVVHAALSKSEYLQFLQQDHRLGARQSELLDTINHYEEELRIFKAGGQTGASR